MTGSSGKLQDKAESERPLYADFEFPEIPENFAEKDDRTLFSIFLHPALVCFKYAMKWIIILLISVSVVMIGQRIIKGKSYRQYKTKEDVCVSETKMIRNYESVVAAFCGKDFMRSPENYSFKVRFEPVTVFIIASFHRYVYSKIIPVTDIKVSYRTAYLLNIYWVCTLIVILLALKFTYLGYVKVLLLNISAEFLNVSSILLLFSIPFAWLFFILGFIIYPLLVGILFPFISAVLLVLSVALAIIGTAIYLALLMILALVCIAEEFKDFIMNKIRASR